MLLLQDLKKLTAEILIGVMLLFTACGDDPSPTTIVYVLGYKTTAYGSSIWKYWKGTKVYVLLDGTTSGWAADIEALGKDVYVSGTDFDSNGVMIAKYWKNGDEKILGSGEASAIAVSGHDVYIAGQTVISEGTKSRTQIKYWKNDVEVVVTEFAGFAVLRSIAVSGADVYIVADWQAEGAKNFTAGYWKNGERVDISPGVYADLRSIAIAGNDVYIAGTTELSATLWKNGVPVRLGDSKYVNSFARAVAVLNNQTYVCGTQYNIQGMSIPTYWIGTIPTEMGTFSTERATDLVIYGSDVYISSDNLEYWKNGVMQEVPGTALDHIWKICVGIE